MNRKKKRRFKVKQYQEISTSPLLVTINFFAYFVHKQNEIKIERTKSKTQNRLMSLNEGKDYFLFLFLFG